MTNVAPVLNITNGTVRFNLLRWIKEWQPGIAAPKENGYYDDSPFMDGRRLSFLRLGNVQETFDCLPYDSTQDELANELSTLRQLLMEIISYSSFRIPNPVYLEMRGSRESEMRYAVLHGWYTPKDGNPFVAPVASCPSVIEGFSLGLERGHWMGEVPGTAVCAEAGSLSVGAGIVESYYDVIWPHDDVFVYFSDSVLHTGNSYLMFGLTSKSRSVHTGLRFTGVNIPVGANIISAYLDVVPTASDSSTTCQGQFYSELSAAPAAYSTYANFFARSLSASSVLWTNPAFVLGVHIKSPDLRTIIQEVVNLSSWDGYGAIAIQLRNTGSTGVGKTRSFASVENLGRDEPRLYITYSYNGVTYGIEATCGNMYVANKQNKSQITNIYYYDASLASYSANLASAALPTTLLPAVPAVGDKLYFIVNTALHDVGPFWSIIFDLIGGTGLTGEWKHLTNPVGPVFTNLGDTHDYTYNLSADGVCEVSWGNIATVPVWVEGTINGITGWIVCYEITAVFDPEPPQQQNRRIFSAITAFADIEADQIPGDLPALLKIDVTGISGGSRVIVGSRRLSRGEDFCAYLNIADEQNPPGVSASVSGGGAFANSLDAPSGRCFSFTPGGVITMTSLISITISETVAKQYWGAYHGFIRYNVDTAWTTTPPAYLQLYVRDAQLGQYKKSSIVGCACSADGAHMYLADMGTVYIGAGGGGDLDYPTNIELLVYGQIDDAAAVLKLFDVVLIPTDEWAGDFKDASENPASPLWLDHGVRMEISGLRDFRKAAYAPVITSGTLIPEAKLGEYRTITNDRPQLLYGEHQRVWFLMENADYSDVYGLLAVKFSINPQYFSMRGNQ